MGYRSWVKIKLVTFLSVCAEFVLKHVEFAHLREVPEFPNSLRPVDVEEDDIIDAVAEDGADPMGGRSSSGGLALVCELVRQVVEAHQPTATRLHIGCDEVWCLGQSPATAAVMEARGLSLVDLFLRHVAAVARFAKEVQPNLQVPVPIVTIFVFAKFLYL